MNPIFSILDLLKGRYELRSHREYINAGGIRVEAKGFATLMYKRFGPGVAFAYLETPKEYGSHVIELLELPG